MSDTEKLAAMDMERWIARVKEGRLEVEQLLEDGDYEAGLPAAWEKGFFRSPQSGYGCDPPTALKALREGLELRESIARADYNQARDRLEMFDETWHGVLVAANSARDLP